MRTMLRGKFTLLFMMLGLLLAVPAIALADDIRDGLDTSAQETQTITAGDSTSTGFTNEYWIVANGSGTSPSGCDVLNPGDSITATFKVNTPPGVTASVSSLTFDECRVGSDLNSQTVKFTSNTPGNYTIPAVTKTSGTGTYTVDNTDFKLVVNDNCPSGDTSGNLQDGKCTANTPPVVSVSGVTNGDSYEHGAVPAAGCNVTDAEDTNESATPVKDSSGLNSYGLGSEKVTCTYTDGGGVTKSASATYNIVDTTKPVIAAHGPVTAEATGPNGAEVTYTAPTANDAVYGSVDVECLPASGSQFSLGDTTVTCTATDGSGNEATPTTFKVTVADKTPPEIAPHADITGVEATGADGATVNYTKPNATDNVDANVTVNCAPASGTKFSLGDTTVTCNAKDAAGNEATPTTFKVTVSDTTAPTIAPHADITGVEATGPDGATVNYTKPNASDAVDPSPTVTCTPASGATFPLGNTTVNCTAKDAAGNESAPSSFKVTVVDTTAPALDSHDDVTAEATGPNGATVNYTKPNASDAVDPSPTVTCTPASGATFPLGNTTVSCTAKDAAGNESAAKTFVVKVQDTTKPELTLPDNITEEATGPNGNVVTYSASAEDVVSGSVNVDCTPASGSTFAITTTTVNCSATDAANNEATGSFTVKVQDTIAPSNIQFVGNINDGDSFYFGSVPDAPTCTATDGGSGLNAAGCVVSGHSNLVGTHTLKATATDKAGNTATKEITYTVKAWTTKGFYSPVDMGSVVNTVKGGSTVPLKFELFAGTTEVTDTSAIKFTATKTNCAPNATEDAIEVTATGGTSLRYDSTGGQFIYNWKTPTGAGCYTVTMTAGGSTITAYFKSLK